MRGIEKSGPATSGTVLRLVGAVQSGGVALGVVRIDCKEMSTAVGDTLSVPIPALSAGDRFPVPLHRKGPPTKVTLGAEIESKLYFFS